MSPQEWFTFLEVVRLLNHNVTDDGNIPGDFGGNAHRGTGDIQCKVLASLSSMKYLELELA